MTTKKFVKDGTSYIIISCCPLRNTGIKNVSHFGYVLDYFLNFTVAKNIK